MKSAQLSNVIQPPDLTRVWWVPRCRGLINNSLRLLNCALKPSQVIPRSLCSEVAIYLKKKKKVFWEVTKIWAANKDCAERANPTWGNGIGQKSKYTWRELNQRLGDTRRRLRCRSRIKCFYQRSNKVIAGADRHKNEWMCMNVNMMMMYQ